MSGTNSLTIGTDRALYIGELPATGWHRHASAVLLIGLSGRFAVHLPGGVVNSCHSALIDAGIDHVFDPRGERVALMYLEPDSPEARRLRGHFRENGPVIWDPAIRPVSRSSFGNYLSAFDLPSLLCHPCPEPAFLDPRVENGLRYLRLSRGGPPDRQDTASAVQLSASRFNHLFRIETGVSFRSYRIWSQIRRAMFALAPRINLTEAALHGDFTDSSHFSRTFRKTFGMTPSSVLKPLKELTVI